MKNKIHSPFHAATAAFILVCACQSHAQTVYIGPTDGDYATAGNWSGGIIPGNSNANGAYIGSSSNQSVIYNTATSYTSTGTGGGNRLIVGGPGTTGGLTLSGSAGTLTFGGDQYSSAAWIGSANSGSSSSGTVTVSAGKLAITGGSEASINLGVLTGGSGTRSGTLIINGGTVEVNRRILMGANSSSVSGTITISSGTLDMKGTGSNAEGDSGQIRFGAGTNTVNLDGGTLITKGFYISDFANAAVSNIYFNGTTIKANTNNADFITGGTGNAGLRMKSGGLVFDTNGFNVNLNDTLTEISGQSAILRKEGSGTFTITTSQTRTGTTTVNGGTLRVGAGALGTGATTVNNGAILDLDANDVWGNHSGSAQSLTINSGGLVTNGTLTNRGFNGMQALTINGGELRVTGTARGLSDGSLYKFEAYSIRDTVTVGGTTASLISNPTNIANAGINIGGVTNLGGGVGSNLTFNVANVTSSNAPDLTVSAVLKNNYTSGSFSSLSNGLVKEGSGTMVLSAANVYSGPTIINAGTLTLANNSAAGSGAISLTGATSKLEINPGVTLANGGNDITITNASASVIRKLDSGTAYTLGSGIDLKSQLTGGTNTTANLLAGTHTDSATDLTMTFSTTSGATNDGIRRSDVLTIDSSATDTFVIQLSAAGLATGSVLAWNQSGTWVNAVTGNTGAGGLAGYHSKSFAQFLTDNGGSFNAGNMLGAFGFDSGGTSVWAVVNHTGSFAAVPEPTSALAGLLITAGLLRRRRS